MMQLVAQYSCLDQSGTRVRHKGSMGCHTKHMKCQSTSHPVRIAAELVANKPYFNISVAYRHTFVSELDSLGPKYTRFVIWRGVYPKYLQNSTQTSEPFFWYP